MTITHDQALAALKELMIHTSSVWSGNDGPDKTLRAYIAQNRETVAVSGWQPIREWRGEDGRVILTIHEDDLYPVCAFCIEGQWLRQTEGPEDVYGPGKWEPLYRAPTHWRELPNHPQKEC